MKPTGIKLVAQNKKAYHDYFIEETLEAGIALTGTEVKSIRSGRANLRDSYAAVENGELFLVGAHISPYEQGNIHNHDPLRTRKLLVHARELRRLHGKVKVAGLYLGAHQDVLQRRSGQGGDRPGQGQGSVRQAPDSGHERGGARHGQGLPPRRAGRMSLAPERSA